MTPGAHLGAGWISRERGATCFGDDQYGRGTLGL